MRAGRLRVAAIAVLLAAFAARARCPAPPGGAVMESRLVHSPYGLAATPLAMPRAAHDRHVPTGAPAVAPVTSRGPATQRGPAQAPGSGPTPARIPLETPHVARTAALPTEVRTEIPEQAPDTAEHTGPGERGLFELQLGRVAHRVIRAYRINGHTLLSASAFLDLAEVRHAAASGRITGRVEPGAVELVLDPAEGLVRTGSRTMRVAAAELLAIDGQVFVSTEILATLFDLSVDVDEAGATVSVHNPDRLPVAVRQRREAARAIVLEAGRSAGGDALARADDAGASGVVLTYDVRTSTADIGSSTGYDLGAATGGLHGVLSMQAHGTGSVAPLLDGAWTGIWPRGRLLTQLRVGDGLGAGTHPRASRGVLATNAPLVRRLLVEDLPFAGSLPPDWSVEAYRGGHLLAFDSVGTSGRYELAVPVEYGENPVALVAYGPNGEIRTHERTFVVLPSMLRPGAFEYGISAGACRLERCGTNGAVDLRYGVARRLTVRTGLDGAWGAGAPDRADPYLAIAATPLDPIALEVEGVARSYGRIVARVEPSPRVRAIGEHVRYSGSSTGSRLVPAGARSYSSVYARLQPGKGDRSVILEAQATRTVTREGASTQARIGATLQELPVVLRPYLRGERSAIGSTHEEAYAGIETTLLPMAGTGPLLRGAFVTGALEARLGQRLSRASITVSRNVGQAVRLEGGVRWDRAGGSTVTLAMISQLRAMRSTSLLTAAPAQDAARLDQSVAGSVVWRPSEGAVTLYREPALDRGGVAGSVFLDADGDGRRGPDEPGIPGVVIQIGAHSAIAGPEGAYSVWGLSPYEDLAISVDSVSLTSPWWTPEQGALLVMPTRGQYTTVDVPIVVGGVVEGAVAWAGDSSGRLERVLPVVLHRRGARERYTVETFEDGGFYRMGLPPGSYEAAVDPATLAALGLRADTARFEVSARLPARGGGPVSHAAALAASGSRTTAVRILVRTASPVPAAAH
jgi:hypothetical protein